MLDHWTEGLTTEEVEIIANRGLGTVEINHFKHGGGENMRGRAKVGAGYFGSKSSSSHARHRHEPAKSYRYSKKGRSKSKKK